ncbi:MAG: hypothetical protein CMO81_08155 [Waddliaceae bacterium]|nr:hypothetical protein [Waddliaceae bacterium]
MKALKDLLTVTYLTPDGDYANGQAFCAIYASTKNRTFKQNPFSVFTRRDLGIRLVILLNTVSIQLR